MNQIQAIRRNSDRRAIEQIRKLIPKINQGYKDIKKLKDKLK